MCDREEAGDAHDGNLAFDVCVCVCARACVAGDAQEGNVAVAFDVSLALLKGREVRYGNEVER